MEPRSDVASGPDAAPASDLPPGSSAVPGVPRPAWRTAVLVTALACCALVAARLALAPGEPAAAERGALLRARLGALAIQREFVDEDARYLLLDAEAATLTLFHGAAPLRSWPLHGVEAGKRRILPGTARSWTGRWDGARMEPPVRQERRVIVSDQVEPPDLTGAVAWIPPLPEEAVPTPPRFVVHYQGGLGLEVLALATDSARAEAGLLARLEHRLRRLLPGNWDRYRIRVVMPADEAGALYRSLPDSTSFVAVLPGR